MKAMKYLVSGALVLSMSVAANAQVADYKTMLEPILKELKASPNDKNVAKDLLKTYNKTFKKDPEALTALGNVYLAVKNYEMADHYANLAIARNKNYGNAYILKGDIQAMQDEGGGAAMWYRQSIELDPKNPQAYMSYSNVYRKIDPKESERMLMELKKNVPDFPIEAEAAHSFYNTGNYDKALEYFLKSDINKLEESHLTEYSVTATSLGNREKALEVAKVGISKFPANISFVRLALINTIGLEKFEEALGYAEKLISNEGENNSGDLCYYGNALAGNKRYEEAIAKYEKALTIDGTNIMPYKYIAAAYNGMGQEDKALEYSAIYLDKNPNAKLADYRDIADIYLNKIKKAKETEDANGIEANFAKLVGVYDQVVEKYPQAKVWSIYQKANAAFTVELDDKSVPYFTEIINILENKTDRSDNENYYLGTSYSRMGYYHWSKNDLEAAGPFFDKCITITPNDNIAKTWFQKKAEAEAENTETEQSQSATE
ncbi:tetratricopeptide repeat protein [Prevotella sp. OH937_COT-195]|uniref:tetratricopeptide repeat protein n=1 Tax=Prevotella sp. OH937_COT-195 TaxID=2491051 RepID=UPI000F64CC6A|nr:tetratricopeptide repeat protein [Prevotella sp. OH937_COT-195]RRD02087.1 tetratricopeptide repeat protein [Prevotella sp. OH937_COT-195]